MSEQNSKNTIDNSEESTQKKLLQYINNDMSAAEIQQFENEIQDDEFTLDAIDGLEKIAPGQIPQILSDVNHQLTVAINKKKKAKRKMPFQNFSWTYLAVLLILLLMIITYLIFLYL